MKNKILITIKFVLALFLVLIWFLLIQAEYEMISKPWLQNDFPFIKGIYAVLFLGFIVLAISVIIFLLTRNIFRFYKKLKT